MLYSLCWAFVFLTTLIGSTLMSIFLRLELFQNASQSLTLNQTSSLSPSTNVWLFAVAGIGGFKNGAQRNVKADLL
jgi:hypothetical protein